MPVERHCLHRVPITNQELIVFDDLIEHEACNNSDELRAVLIFDVCKPLLSANEREMINAMAKD